MSRLRELIDELCPDGVEYRPIRELYTKLRGTPITAAMMKKIANDDGDTIIYAGGKTIVRANESDIPKANVIRRPSVVVQSRGVIDCIYCDEPFTFKNEMWAYTCNDVDSVKYLYYALKSNIDKLRVLASAMSSLPQIAARDTEEIRIPVPPIEVQREIVRILDSFQELDDALTAEIKAREKQYRFVQEQCLVKYFGDPVQTKPSMDNVKLGDLYDVTSSQRIYQSEQSADGVPFLRVSDLIAKMDGHNVEGSLFISDDMYQSLVDAGNVPEPGDILVTARGTLGRYYFIDEDDKFYFQDGMITWLRTTGNSPSHAFFSALFSNERFLDRLVSNCGQGTVKYLSIKGLSNTLVPRPDVNKLKMFDDEMSDYEQIARLAGDLRSERDARRKQFEYYRDRLLAFPEKVA